MNNDPQATALRQLLITQGDLRSLGQGEVGYIRQYAQDGETAFVLHGADGRAVSVHQTLDGARQDAWEKSLNLAPMQ